MKKYAWITLIVIAAGLLRFWGLTRVPPALNSDEVAIGYNAYSVLQTGKDEYGTSYPFLFRSFDDYKMPVYVYLVSAGIKIFGYGDFAVRFPSALAGTLTVLMTYLLVRKLFVRRRVALASALFLAISPWAIQFSRAGYEANVAVLFIVSATYLFLCGLKKGWLLIVSSVLYSLAVWTYLTPRIFVPLLALGLGVMYRKELLRKKYFALAAVSIALLMLLPVVRMSLSPQGQMRASGVSAFADPDIIRKSAERLARDRVAGMGLLTVFDNRRIAYALTFIRGYFEHFDPTFLFLDRSVEKYRAPDVGLLYLFDLPFILAGLYMLAKERGQGSRLLFWWAVISPVAAAFTLQLPHPVRTLVFLPSLQIISAVGFVSLWDKKTWVRIAVIVFMTVNVLFYLHQYYVVLPVEEAGAWYYGRMQMTQKINEYRNSFDTVYVSNSLDFPYIFYLYYAGVNPAQYLKQGGTVSGGFNEQGNHFSNIKFRSISPSLRESGKKILFVGLPGEVFRQSLVRDTVYFPDGTPGISFFY